MKKIILSTIVFMLLSFNLIAQWTELMSGVPGLAVFDISTNQGKLYAVGTQINGTNFTPLIFRSYNNGATWDTIKVQPTGYLFETIAFVNHDIGYIGVGGCGCIVQTTDGGSTWNYFYQNPNGSAINDIEVIDTTSAVACGFGPSLYSSGSAYTLTNQFNWTPTGQSFSNVTLDDMQMLDKDTGYALSLYNKQLFKTTNGGNTWDSIYAFPTVAEKMYWWNTHNGIAVGFNASYYRTNDGGLHWTKDSIAGYNNELTGVDFLDANNGFISAAGGKIFHSTDGGMNWQADTTNFGNDDFFNLEVHGSKAFALGNNGKIYSYLNVAGISDIDKEEANVFPNPSTNTVTIQTPHFIESIEMTDLTGRIVLMEHNIHKKEWRLDISSLQQGIYFLKMVSNETSYFKKIQKI